MATPKANMFDKLPPSNQEPEIGDLCKLQGGSLHFINKHGVGIVVGIHFESYTRIPQYEIKWLKSDKHMRFAKGDIEVVSRVS